MTLIKKMALVVLAMLFVIFIGTSLIMMNNARNFFIKQIESNAQDTATSLGLSLSQVVSVRDKTTMSSMVQAIFDSGYFSSIIIKDMKDRIIISKRRGTSSSAEPDWFVKLVQWPPTEKSSLIMNGWIQAGVIYVTSDPGYVYHSLWNNAVSMLKAYLVFAIIALALVYMFIQFILSPLKRVTAQALAISEHEFPIEENIPNTPELKQVTLAMNQMVIKLKSLIQEQVNQTEALRVQVYQDQLTGMSNRRYFLQQLSSILDNEDEFVPGHVLLVVIDGLDDLNQQLGYQQGDKLVLAVAKTCREFWKQESVRVLARINGSTFALINTERDPVVFEKDCNKFEIELRNAIKDFGICEIHMGATAYFAHQTVSNLLTITDSSVKQARHNGVFYCQREHDAFKYPRLVTGEDLKNSLQQKTMTLYAQAVTDGKQTLHKELFVRIRDNNGEELGAGYFMPVAEKLGVAHLIDLYVINEIIANEELSTECFALNLSLDTLLNKEHSSAYLKHLKHIPQQILKNLVLEINEAIVLAYFDEIKTFAKQAKKIGVKIGVDRVGIHFSPLHYLSELHVDYLKLHGSLVQDLEENESKQFFIHYFNEMAKTLDIRVVATQVEHHTQWETIQKAHIMWGQGRYLAMVESLNRAIPPVK